jgi:hypothetical protein
MAELRQIEKKVRRFPARVAPVTEEGKEVLNFGPAVPARMRSTMLWGIHAYLQKSIVCQYWDWKSLPLIMMKELDTKSSDNPSHDRSYDNPNLNC